MKYLFILGRNPELSIAELKAVLGDFEFVRNKNAILVEMNEILEAGFVDKLGGVIEIGQVLASGNNVHEVLKTLDKHEIYFGESNKFNYVVWDFSEDTSAPPGVPQKKELGGMVSDYLKQRFKQEKLKTTKKMISEFMELQSGERVMVLESGRLVDDEFFVFSSPNSDEIYFGKTIQRTDYKEIERRDMKKPVRREELSISPRLAKIMINLSGVKENERLIDVFCGVGVILSEALNLDIKVVGVDKDKAAIDGARQNLQHFGFDKEDYKLINYDSAKVEISGKINVLVSEPDFGETLKKIPSDAQARLAVGEFENLMINVLKNISSRVSGKIVFSAPFIKTTRERVGADLEKIAGSCKRKIKTGFPVPEFRKNQFVGREIVVFE